jgi:hypothetical protein
MHCAVANENTKQRHADVFSVSGLAGSPSMLVCTQDVTIDMTGKEAHEGDIAHMPWTWKSFVWHRLFCRANTVA